MPKKRNYDNELFIARRIAGCEPGEDASFNFSQAILNCKSHFLFAGNKHIHAEYLNEFGPTCGVDDIIERMTMKDWRIMCDHLVHNLLTRSGLMPKNPCKIPSPRVIVRLHPEKDSDVVNKVEFDIIVPAKLRNLLARAILKVKEV